MKTKEDELLMKGVMEVNILQNTYIPSQVKCLIDVKNDIEPGTPIKG